MGGTHASAFHTSTGALAPPGTFDGPLTVRCETRLHALGGRLASAMRVDTAHTV